MGINFLLILFKVMDLSLSVSFLVRLEVVFLLKSTSSPPRLAGKRIKKAAIKINPPPNQETNALQRCKVLERRSFSNTGKPVVVKAPTISRYASIKSLSGKIIHVGNAKNNGSNKNSKIKEMSCVTPVSFKFLLEVASLTKEKIRNPVRLLYKKILASLKDSTKNAYTERVNIKPQAIANT
tara:strand:- start:217 stop:759 length:543 start_codon:yes stop_codon:yes gene_type:complete